MEQIMEYVLLAIPIVIGITAGIIITVTNSQFTHPIAVLI